MWTGGCEDPRVVEGEDGLYVMTYTQWNQKDWRLAIATSKDLVKWEKHGPAFAKALEGKYAKLKCKSGAIVCKLDGDRLKAVKINGKYWMYWGVGVVYLAYSDNLVDWTIVENSKGEKIAVLQGRDGHFDSSMVEGGPPAVLTDKGVGLLVMGLVAVALSLGYHFAELGIIAVLGLSTLYAVSTTGVLLSTFVGSRFEERLAPGGRLFVAVPDFDKVVCAMEQNVPDPNLEAYIMGGQTDVHDFHCAIFNEGKLRQLLELAGFQRIAEVGKEGEKWNCSHHWCSLNMEAFA
jgi:hypothetical protein